MFGYDKSYSELLEESGFESLKTRRETAILRFARKIEKNPVYSHWLEENPNPRSQSLRNTKKYTKKLARTSRLYNSPLFKVRRLLNETPEEPPVDQMAYDFALNDPYRN